jgi:hypothetical protein
VGWRGGSGGGALPCHSHKPDPWSSSLGDVVSDNTIACPLKSRNAAAIDKLTRSVAFSRTGRNLTRWRQFCPKLTYSNVAGQVALIDLRLDPRGAYGWPRLGVLLQARVWGAALEISPKPGAAPSLAPCVAPPDALRLLWRIVCGRRRSKNLAKSRLLQCCGSNRGLATHGPVPRGCRGYPRPKPLPHRSATAYRGRSAIRRFHANFTLRKMRRVAHLLKPYWRTQMLDGLGIKLLDFPSDWLPGRPLRKRALHPRLIRLASVIVISLLSLGLWVAISEAVISIAVR